MLTLLYFRYLLFAILSFFFSSRRRHTRCALVTGVQTCALPIYLRRRHSRNSDAQIAVDLAGHIDAELRLGSAGGKQERRPRHCQSVQYLHRESLPSNLRGFSHFHWSSNSGGRFLNGAASITDRKGVV